MAGCRVNGVLPALGSVRTDIKEIWITGVRVMKHDGAKSMFVIRLIQVSSFLVLTPFEGMPKAKMYKAAGLMLNGYHHAFGSLPQIFSQFLQLKVNLS
jgi:hypothetical protein